METNEGKADVIYGMSKMYLDENSLKDIQTFKKIVFSLVNIGKQGETAPPGIALKTVVAPVHRC